MLTIKNIFKNTSKRAFNRTSNEILYILVPYSDTILHSCTPVTNLEKREIANIHFELKLLIYRNLNFDENASHVKYALATFVF